MIPTARLAALCFAATMVAVVAGYLPAWRTVLFAFDALLAVAAVADVLAVNVGARRVLVEREVARILSVGRPNAVALRLRNTGRRTLRGQVSDDPLVNAEVTGLPARFVLPPRSEITVRYGITPTRRGPRQLDAVTVRYLAPLGLVARQERTRLPRTADVYPDVHAARSLELLRRQGRQDARMGSLRVRGGDTEFERLRPYQRGDEVRYIDWRASARRDDLTVRQFQAESNQNVVFALDIGRGMRGEHGGLTSVDHALNAALLAADVAIRAGDRAGLLAFDDAPRAFLRPSGGRSGARKLTRAVHDLEAGLAATDYRAAMTFVRGQVKARSLLIVFTNLLDPRSAKELSSALRGLLPRHLPLCVVMQDSDVEELAAVPATRADDLYVRAAAAEALAWRETLLRDLRRAGVLVLDAAPASITPELVKSYLDIKARRLL